MDAVTVNSVRPMILGAPIVKENESIFPLAREMIRIQAPRALICDIIEACNGQRTLDVVLNLLESKWDRDTLNNFLMHLLEKGALCDSSNVSGFVWPFVSNPSYFAKSVTELQVSEMVNRACLAHRNHSPEQTFLVGEFAFRGLVEGRCSQRSFSGRTIDIQKVIHMLWSGYGIITGSYEKIGFDRHTVPSAGALYPLRLSLALLQSSDSELSKGVYDVSFSADGSVGLTLLADNLVPIYQSFVDPMILKNAAGVIFVSGSFGVTGEKYGNRSLLYVPLEAGHVVQNIHLAATDLGLATVEIGGFLEEVVREGVALPAEYMPLVSVVFGEADNSTDSDGLSNASFDVRWMPPKAGGYVLPFNLAFAQLKDISAESKDWSCGRSMDPFLAHAKVIAEAEEWVSCGFPLNLVESTKESLGGAISPDALIAFHPDQYNLPNFPFYPFDPDGTYEWKEVTDVASGEKRYVLADCIYFPYYPKYPRYASANSSGAAAYPDRDGAIERATLELIERDAFMIVWLNRLVMPTINVDSLPENIRCRIQKLEEEGFSVAVKDLTLDLAPVILILVQSEDLHYTTCSACSSFDRVEALDHALMETESAVYCRLAFGFSEPILPEDVRMTQDHGKLYEQEAFFRQADFLKESRLLKNIDDVGEGACLSWETLLARLAEKERSILVVDLEIPEANGIRSNLYKVKAFVTGLVPISFGYGEEPCGMQRIYEVPVALGFRSEQLCYDELNKFPHCYT